MGIRPSSDEQAAQADVVRDVIGNPFRREAIDPAWLPANDGAVTRIAEGGAIADLPVLADALEDAGCTSRALLDHCRGPGPHVAGCWVVDLVLGREEGGRRVSCRWKAATHPPSPLPLKGRGGPEATLKT